MGCSRASHFSHVSASRLEAGSPPQSRTCTLAIRRVGMVSRVGVSEDFRKQVLGYGLTTAEILYRMPDHPSLLQTYVWQNYDLFPKFPVLQDFLEFWQAKLDGPLYSVLVAPSNVIKRADLRAFDGVFRLN